LSDLKNHIIKSVQKKKYTPNCLIYFNYSELDNALVISTDLVVKYGLKKGMELSDNFYHILLQEQRIINIKNSAYSFASYKPRTEKQVRQRLSAKGFFDKEIDIAINFLYDFKLLDDYTFARQFCIDYMKRKNISRYKLYQEIIKRGIQKELADEISRDTYPLNQLDTIIRKAANKKLKSISYKPLRKQKESLISYLKRQGFSWTDINPVLNEIWKEKM